MLYHEDHEGREEKCINHGFRGLRRLNKRQDEIGMGLSAYGGGYHERHEGA